MNNETMVQPKARLKPRVAFYLLMSFVTLYITLFSMGGTTFLLLDKWFPDVTEYGGVFDPAVRNFLAALIVGLPVFLLTNFLFMKSARMDANVRKSGSWRWLTYITLFVAGVVILGNLIALVYNLLNGEFTLRFILKVLTIFVLAGGAFAYYFWDTREAHEREEAASHVPQIFNYALLGLGLLVVIVGLVSAGSPLQAKRERQDQMRTAALQSIRASIDSYAVRHNYTLPEKLVDGVADFDNVTFPKDPITNQPYEYHVKGAPAIYELCATFEAPSNPNITQPMYGIDYDTFWKHGAGRTCYELTTKPLVKDGPIM